MSISHKAKLILILSACVVFVALLIGLVLGSVARKPAMPDDLTLEKPVFAEVDANEASLPGYGNIYVNDYAELLDSEAEARITEQLISLYDRSGIELTVLTIGQRADYGDARTIEVFATALFNEWGIGNANRNDGVLILVSRFDREMRIELGSGYGTGLNSLAQAVIDGHFLPHFRKEAYQAGIEEGVAETIEMVVGVHPGDAELGVVRRGWSIAWRWLQGIGWWLLPILAVPLGVFVKGYHILDRNLVRTCPSCAKKMYRLIEDVEDAHLDGGQQLEERLKSVDYDVWLCPACEHLTIRRFKAWFGGYGPCPSCKYRTQEADTTVLVSATKSSTGRKRIDYNCKHCGHVHSETRTIPKISSSSSSGGSSSFGGGSSSGGGASGSW